MRLTVFLILLGLLRVGATGYAQVYRINLDVENVTCGKVIESVKKQTNLDFFFSNEELNVNRKVSVSCKNASLEDALQQILGNGYSFRLVDNTVVIRPVRAQDAPQVKQMTVKGVVKDTKHVPLPGVTVLLKGTSIGTATNADGQFSLTLPETKSPVFVFSFIGMKSVEVRYAGQPELKVTMQEDAAQIDEVVVTGIFERKAESFTGSTSTYKAADLKMVGNQNVLQSLRTLDPSFHITPNNEFGSDPNRLPDIDIRGKTSVVNLKEEYQVDPNQPLFILDGFEVPLQTIVDLNMDRVASVTILKDAASTAIYGSRAANGVVVVETKRPEPGKLRVSYNGDFQVTFPDLTDYNMMNASEKIKFEKLAGVYTAAGAVEQFELNNQYNKILGYVQSGVDSYWLSEPVRTGIVHKHSVYAEGGDDAMRYGIGANYAATNGVMKQSGRDVLGFYIDLLYRKGKFSFNNKFSLDYTESENAPQAFSVYVQTNPYYRKAYQGETPQYLDNTVIQLGDGWTRRIQRPNPLYNGELNHLDAAKSLGFRDNFQIEWRPLDELKAKGRISLSKSADRTEVFKSPFHTDFSELAKTERGSYNKNMSDNWKYDGDVTVTYGKVLAEKHMINAIAGWNFSSSKRINDAYQVIGFPDDAVPYPTFANQYPDSKSIYNESTVRSTSIYANLNYAYDNRYLLDFNFRKDGSSVFGVNKRFSDSWSVGLAWNLHNEMFVGEWLDLFKIRASVGNLGNQNFTAYSSYNTYVYNTNLQNMFGMGANVGTFGNPDLKWQKTMDYNVGADISVFNNRFKVNTNFYKRVTDPMLVSISIASSVGKTMYTTNLGSQETNGMDITVAVSPIYRPADRFTWTITMNGRHQWQKFDNIGNKLDVLNSELKKSSLQRYRDGGSPSDIWLVRSAGIDPMTGNELFIKKDGTVSFDYDNQDEVIVGNSEAKLEGTFGTNFYYKGFSLSAYFRYKVGGYNFNKELYNRIENISDPGKYNQDKRALYDRWQKPGDVAQYRRITSTVQNDKTYPMTDRYLQQENTLTGESMSVGYEFMDRKWLKQAGFSSLGVRANMNDIFRCSTVRAERGTSYPFARTVSFSLNMSF